MPLRKSHPYSSLWKSCDELRGGMDASQYDALPELERRVEDYGARVESHLRRMGLST